MADRNFVTDCFQSGLRLTDAPRVLADKSP
jgi:hypothetical protein